MPRSIDAPRIVPLGDSAVLAEFSETLDLAINARIQQLARAIRARHVPWIRDVVPALGSLALHFDAAQRAPGFSARTVAAELIGECLVAAVSDSDDTARRVEVPVCYEPEVAPDLAEVAENAKDYARKNPGQAILISAAAGLLLGLILRGGRRS